MVAAVVVAVAVAVVLLLAAVVLVQVFVLVVLLGVSWHLFLLVTGLRHYLELGQPIRG